MASWNLSACVHWTVSTKAIGEGTKDRQGKERLEEGDKGQRSGGPIILRSIRAPQKELLHPTAKVGAEAGRRAKRKLEIYKPLRTERDLYNQEIFFFRI